VAKNGSKSFWKESTMNGRVFQPEAVPEAGRLIPPTAGEV